MRLLCVHTDTINALQRLHTPFDDLTPDGLWGTPYHLIGVSTEQRDVLKAFNVDLEDITPAALARALGSGAGGTASGAGSENLNLSSGNGGQIRNGARLRTSYRGRYLEATVQGGKILLDGRSYDSPTHASRGITTNRNEWGFWEVYDDQSGRWQVLEREWQTS
jgi:hypothetical protein